MAIRSKKVELYLSEQHEKVAEAWYKSRGWKVKDRKEEYGRIIVTYVKWFG